MGGPDFIASILGTATVKPGRTCDKGGTSEGINLCAEKSIDGTESLLVMPHIIRPYFNISGVISSSGMALSWFKTRFFPQESFASMYARIAATKPGADGLVFIPYLAGERSPHWDPNARALFLGLGLHHDHNTMARAVLEGTCFVLREVLEEMELAGASVDDMRATGLPSQFDVYNQAKADITGKRILVSAFPEPELLGDVAIGKFGLGMEHNLSEAAEHVFVPNRIFEPRAETKSRYQVLYELYKESYKRLADLFPKIVALQMS